MRNFGNFPIKCKGTSNLKIISQTQDKPDAIPEETDPTHQQPSVPEKRRSIFDFSTYPRPKFFDRKPKPKPEFVTSSPKETRQQSVESSTFPRAKKSGLSLTARWAQRFGEATHAFHDDTALERSKPWRHPSLEEPRLSLKPQTSKEEEIPWENEGRMVYEDDRIGDVEEDKSYGYETKVVHTC